MIGDKHVVEVGLDMRFAASLALAVLGFGCGGPTRQPPTRPTEKPRAPASVAASELVCPPSNKPREQTPNATLPVERGGYRRLPDQTALSTFVNAVSSYTGANQSQIDAVRESQAANALSAALLDMKPELRACIEKADKVVPNLQYTLRAQMFGKAVAGTYVSHVSFQRIEAAGEVSTTAEACVADLVTRIELPPSLGLSEMLTILRYDDCTPKIYIAKADVQRYATKGYAAWSAAHPGKQCPDRIEDLSREVGEQAAEDPWGHAYRLFCGASLPQGASGVGIMSIGRDGTFGTDDDIESWNTLSITRGR